MHAKNTLFATAISAALAAGCGGSDPTVEQAAARCNALDAETVDAVMLLEQGIAASLAALDTEDYEAYNAYWQSTARGQVKDALAKAEAALAAHEQLGAVASPVADSPFGLVEGSRIGRRVQALEPLATFLAITAVGSLVLWLSDTDKQLEKDIAAGGDEVETYVEQRTRMIMVRDGVPEHEARLFAEQEASSGRVTIPAAFRTVERAGSNLATSAGKQLLETAVDQVPVVNGAVKLKQAWDTGTLIGQQGACEGKQDGARAPYSTGGGCKLYVGRSSDGSFSGLPPGSWTLVFSAEGWEPAALEGVAVSEGGTTEVDGSAWLELGAGNEPEPGPGPGPSGDGDCATLQRCCPKLGDSSAAEAVKQCNDLAAKGNDGHCRIMLNNLAMTRLCEE